MSCIVYQVNKKTGVKYAYESISYWDKEKQQPRSKRKYLGRVDPETGEIIKNKSHNRAETTEKNDMELGPLYAQLAEKDEVISSLKEELESVNKKYKTLQDSVNRLRLFMSEEFGDV